MERVIEHHEDQLVQGADPASYFILFFSDGADTVTRNMHLLRKNIIRSSERIKQRGVLSHFVVVGIGEQSDTRIGVTAKIASTTLEFGDRTACVYFARQAKSLGRAVNTLIGELAPNLAGFHVNVALPPGTRRLGPVGLTGIVECFGEPPKPAMDIQISAANNKELLVLSVDLPQRVILNDFEFQVEASPLPPLDIDVLRVVRAQAQGLRMRMVAGMAIDRGVADLQMFVREVGLFSFLFASVINPRQRP